MDKLGTIPVFSTEDIEHPKRSILYWGPTKSGKTHNMLTFPKPFVVYWDDNLSTLLKFKVPFVNKNANGSPLSFDEFKLQILPAIKNREIDAETIVFDSYSFCSQRLRRAVQGTRDKMRVQDWSKVFDPLMEITKELTEICKPDPYNPDKRTYNFVASVHERDKYQEGTDEEEHFVGYDPSVQGQFKDWLPRFFDTVLVTDVEYTVKIVDNTPQRIAKHIVHSIPPNKFWHCGDGVGGGIGDKEDEWAPGTPKRLPAKLSGTYQSLMEAWGIEE